MKQIFTILIFLGMVFTIYAQDFETGKIAISLSDAGRVRVSAPNFEKQQIDRSSLLFGVSKNEVFSYNSDADSMIAAITVESPLLSDFELTGIADNSYSDLPPDVENEIHVYGWQDEGFVIVKMSLKNLESSTINGIFGLEILPRVDGDYGSEVVESNDRVYTTYRPTTIISPTTTYTGYKFLSHSMVSMKIIDWYSGYDAVDNDLFLWLDNGGIDPMYESGADGTVSILGTSAVNISSNDVADLYFAIAVSEDKDDMLANIVLAEEKYTAITSVQRDDENIPSEYELAQNYPNPFNPATTINFSLPVESNVSLTIYNAIGEVVEASINSTLSAGNYNYNFDASKLSSGIYFYTLSSNNFVQTRKMMLIK